MNIPRHSSDSDGRRSANPADQSARDQLFSGDWFDGQPPAEIAGAGSAGEPVNDYSRAVQTREQFPLHFDLLMRDLFARGEAPEDWQVLSADEVRIDEDGMEVEFTLLKTGTDLLWRRRVDVQLGQLRAITDC